LKFVLVNFYILFLYFVYSSVVVATVQSWNAFYFTLWIATGTIPVSNAQHVTPHLQMSEEVVSPVME